MYSAAYASANDGRSCAALVGGFSLPPLSSVTTICPKIKYSVFCRSHPEFNLTAKSLMFNVEHKIYSGNNFCAFAKFPDLYSLLHQKFLYSVTGTVWKGNHMYTYIIRRRRRRRQRRRRRRRRRRREEEKKGRRRRRRRRRRKIRRVSNVTAMEHSPITTEQVE